jgi:prevent-host-death family protein
MSDPTVNVHYAKTHLSRLLERVLAGEPVTIAKAGTPVARLVPLSADAVATPRAPGAVRETVTPYRAASPVEVPSAPRRVTAREFAARWKTLPRLSAEDAESMARDIEDARRGLPPVRSPWE